VIDFLKKRGQTISSSSEGGIVPEEDLPVLNQAGVKGIFTPGTSIEDAVNWVRKNIKPRN